VDGLIENDDYWNIEYLLGYKILL